MAAVGGSIQEITISGRTYPVAADNEAQLKLGGFEVEVQANGDGSARNIGTRVPWALAGLSVENDQSRGDQEELQRIADSLDFVPISVTYASGIVYQGTGSVSGEMQSSSQSATITFDLMGSGKMTSQ